MALYRAVGSCAAHFWRRVNTKATATKATAAKPTDTKPTDTKAAATKATSSQPKQRLTVRSPYCDIGRYGAEWANRTFATLNQEYRDAVYRENECRMIPPVYNSRNGRPRAFPEAPQAPTEITS